MVVASMIVRPCCLQCSGKAKQGTCGGPRSAYACRRRQGCELDRVTAYGILNTPVRMQALHAWFA